jgi:hypothetical protein
VCQKPSQIICDERCRDAKQHQQREKIYTCHDMRCTHTHTHTYTHTHTHIRRTNHEHSRVRTFKISRHTHTHTHTHTRASYAIRVKEHGRVSEIKMLETHNHTRMHTQQHNQKHKQCKHTAAAAAHTHTHTHTKTPESGQTKTQQQQQQQHTGFASVGSITMGRLSELRTSMEPERVNSGDTEAANEEGRDCPEEDEVRS